MDISRYQLDSYRNEYERIRKEIPAVKQRKQDARAEGDLRENTEYDIASSEYEQLMRRMSQLEEIISSANVIDADAGTRIGLGSFVRIKCLTLPDNKERVLRVDANGDPVSDKNNQVLGIKSPLGRKVFNGVSGDYKIQAPAGELVYHVEKITLEEVKKFYEGCVEGQ